MKPNLLWVIVNVLTCLYFYDWGMAGEDGVGLYDSVFFGILIDVPQANCLKSKWK